QAQRENCPAVPAGAGQAGQTGTAARCRGAHRLAEVSCLRHRELSPLCLSRPQQLPRITVPRRAISGVVGVLLRWLLVGRRLAGRSADFAGVFTALKPGPAAGHRLEPELDADSSLPHREARRGASRSGNADAEPGPLGAPRRESLATNGTDIHLEAEAGSQ